MVGNTWNLEGGCEDVGIRACDSFCCRRASERACVRANVRIVRLRLNSASASVVQLRCGWESLRWGNWIANSKGPHVCPP